MLSKFQGIISKIVLTCLAIFTTVVLVQMGHFFTINYLQVEPVLAVLVFLCAIIFVGAGGYCLYRIRDNDANLNRLILISLLLIFAVVALVWLKLVPQTQVSDFKAFWRMAPKALDGKAIYQYDNDYFAKWAYQTGFLVYVMTVVKIFGHNIIAIQLLNVLYQVLILLMSYILAMQLFNKVKIARLSVFILMIDLDWFALNSQADNQYLGMLLFLVTFYLIMKDKYWTYSLAGVTLALGSIIRPIGPVVIAGIVVYALLYMAIQNNQFHWKNLGKLLVTLIIYQVLFSSAGMAIKSSGLNSYGLTNRDSEWKFVVGLDANSNGSYDQGMVNRFNLKDSRAKMSRQEHQIIRENIQNLNANHGWLKLLWNKNETLWAGRAITIDFTGFETRHSLRVSNFVKLLGYLGTVVLIILSWIGSLRLFKDKPNVKTFLLVLPLMAYAVVQLLIEVQGRYRLEFLPIIAIIGGLGLFTICEWIRSKWGKMNV
ncbi:glycosyltransferase family 39 protein [Companilactobacillus zhachilii]|uniref:ArnT family glycosyltransferase n=1 Tax=Companilactobacillus zhachilii TaxID=2304606 RepID=UPI001922E7EE|nr:glycosyltransferase family 39 protein [Companilactobacillus zhachilii]MBL3531376.1 glycosyltransferase family 39 protein [Companilactobacillus zhachilii]